jgi:hypothetical protein
VPDAVRAALARDGRPLDPPVRARMEETLGEPFADVRIHTDPQAAASATAVGAQAYTFGRDVVFGPQRFAPGTIVGEGLLAHELGHVVEQRAAPRALDVGGVQRAPLGTRFASPKGTKSPHKKITGHFDGATFTLTGDGATVFRVPAQSGRPYTVRAADAAACGGKPDDTYLNNPRYVGIADNGPIPEGTYRFTAAQLVTFSGWEQLQMIGGGSFTDPSGASLHGGDWGAGRVPLSPVTIVAVPKARGNTRARSGFFLHGGSLPGSSGCIDVGNGGIDALVKALPGYGGTITVTVRYTAAVPSVGAAERALGRFTYPSTKDPSLLDRLKSALGGDDH